MTNKLRININMFYQKKNISQINTSHLRLYEPNVYDGPRMISTLYILLFFFFEHNILLMHLPLYDSSLVYITLYTLTLVTYSLRLFHVDKLFFQLKCRTR